MPILSPLLTARATRRAATLHASSSGAPMVFSDGERKPIASSGTTPRFASTRAHSGSTPATRASSETTSVSGSRSRQRAKQGLPNANQAMLRHYTGSSLVQGSLPRKDRVLFWRSSGSSRLVPGSGEKHRRDKEHKREREDKEAARVTSRPSPEVLPDARRALFDSIDLSS